jgi:hypothetical protein
MSFVLSFLPPSYIQEHIAEKRAGDEKKISFRKAESETTSIDSGSGCSRKHIDCGAYLRIETCYWRTDNGALPRKWCYPLACIKLSHKSTKITQVSSFSLSTKVEVQ